MKFLVLMLTVVYSFILLVVWALMHSSANSHWLFTLFLFSPRLVVVIPLVVLVPISLIVRPRIAWLFLVDGLIIFFPILGYQIAGSADASPGPMTNVGILTCNLGGGEFQQDDLIKLIHKHGIEVLMLQECPDSIANPIFEELGWTYHHARNIAVGSSLPVAESVGEIKRSRGQYGAAISVSCEVTLNSTDGTAAEQVNLVSVHLPTFRPGFERLRRFETEEGSIKLDEVAFNYRGFAQQVADDVAQFDTPVIVGGDFNVPVESTHYRDFWGPLRNAFSERGNGLGYTKFTSWHGVRIDHVLVSKEWSVIRTLVGPSLGGDHRPVIVELAKPSLP